MFDIDLFAGDSLGHQQDTAAGPLAASSRQSTLPIDADGRLRLPARAYAPLLSIAPAIDIADTQWRVELARVDPGPPEPVQPLDTLTFAPFSERHGYLPAFAPEAGADGLLPEAIFVQLRLWRDGVAVGAADIAAHLSARYSEGRFAQLLAITQGETVRTRRLAREIAARRTLAHARGFLLDRIGQELAVPRLEDRIRTQGSEMLVEQARETDAAYRNRLAIYRPFLMPTRRALLDRLNGAQSPLRHAGAPAEFAILEEDNPFMAGIKVFGVGPTVAAGEAIRKNYLTWLRDTILLDPMQDVPAARRLPAATRAREQALRLRLRTRLQFASTKARAMAPWLARAFDRLVRLLDLLGVDMPVQIVRCQDDDGDSRFELGLAAEVRAFSAAQLAGIRDALAAGARPAADDREMAGILATLAATDQSAEDGSWLLRVCGFRTITPLGGGRLLLSHFSLGNLRVEGANGLATTTAHARQTFTARLEADSGGIDLALAHALAGGPTGWPDGIADWAILSAAETAATLASLADPMLPMQPAFDAMGLRLPASLSGFRTSLATWPAPSFRLLRLGPTLAAALTAADPVAADQLGFLADTLGANGAASMALLSAGGGPVLIVSSIGLPQIGTNIGPRRSSDFFWGGARLSGDGAIKLAGQGTRILARIHGHSGLFAVFTLAYARIGATDPFEWRVTLPPDRLLTHAQYEILMNMLERMFPIGVEVNSWSIRRRNVSFDGTTTQPLTPSLSRSYRPFRRRRFHAGGASSSS